MTRVMIAVPSHPGWFAVFDPPDSVEVFRENGEGARFTRSRDDVTLSSLALEGVKQLEEGIE